MTKLRCSLLVSILGLVASLSAQTASYTVQGTACAGSNGMLPRISGDGVPSLGATMHVLLEDALPQVPAVMTVGASTSMWAGAPLPFDLGPAAAPGCLIYVSGERIFNLNVDGSGRARCPLNIPMNPALVGAKFFNQFLVADRAANPLGVVTTACGMGVVGS
ncbi:MAG: hypothetical protein AAF628_19200 [Planctomycetota bacterium]